MSLAKKSLRYSGLFEAELLVELMLRYWQHPQAEDRYFRNQLLENAAEVLRDCVAGTRLMESIRPEHMNLVAAVWYAEWSALNSPAPPGESAPEREAWLERVRHALPSCFCDPELLE
jgi:hypothetical protein